MAKLDNEWELIHTEDVASRMVAAMPEADVLEPTHEEAQSWLDLPELKKAIQVEVDNLKAAGTCEVIERLCNTNIGDSK